MEFEDITLKPSLGGKECLGNGTHDDIEIQCDECNYYQECFPQKIGNSNSSIDISKVKEIVNDSDFSFFN